MKAKRHPLLEVKTEIHKHLDNLLWNVSEPLNVHEKRTLIADLKTVNQETAWGVAIKMVFEKNDYDEIENLIQSLASQTFDSFFTMLDITGKVDTTVLLLRSYEPDKTQKPCTSTTS